MPRYIIAACRNAPMANDPDFPVAVAYFDTPTRLDALREAKGYFEAWAAEMKVHRDDVSLEHYTHLRVVDGPSE